MSKNIRVNEKVHNQVKKIADANFRGLGDQVAYWAAMDCPHPVEKREERVAHVVGSNEVFRFFYCRQCKKHVCDSDPTVNGTDKNAAAPRKIAQTVETITA